MEVGKGALLFVDFFVFLFFCCHMSLLKVEIRRTISFLSLISSLISIFYHILTDFVRACVCTCVRHTFIVCSLISKGKHSLAK